MSDRIAVPKIRQKGSYQRTGAARSPPFLRRCSVGADRLVPFRFAAASARRCRLRGTRRRLASLPAPWITTLLLLLFSLPALGGAVRWRTGQEKAPIAPARHPLRYQLQEDQQKGLILSLPSLLIAFGGCRVGSGGATTPRPPRLGGLLR